MSIDQNTIHDKREYVRYPAHRPAILECNTKRLYTTIVNFSQSGVGFLSSHPLQNNEQVEIIFDVEIADKNINYHLPLKFVRAEVHSDGFEYYLGALVNEVTPEYCLLLTKLAEMHDTLNNPSP